MTYISTYTKMKKKREECPNKNLSRQHSVKLFYPQNLKYSVTYNTHV